MKFDQFPKCLFYLFVWMIGHQLDETLASQLAFLLHFLSIGIHTKGGEIIYNALIGFYELNHDGVVEFQGFSYDTSVTFWNKVMAAYAGTDDAAVIESLSDRARIIGYTRLIRRSIRRGGLEDEQRKKEIDHWTEELIGLVSRIDCLSYKA